MAIIDKRVLALTNLLAENGFGWLAGNILQEIEYGRRLNEVDSEQINADRRRIFGAAGDEYPNQRADFEEEPILSLGPEAQVAFAVERMYQALVVSLQEVEAARGYLEAITETPVRMGIHDGETIEMMNRDAALRATETLSRTIEIKKWLLSLDANDAE